MEEKQSDRTGQMLIFLLSVRVSLSHIFNLHKGQNKEELNIAEHALL